MELIGNLFEDIPPTLPGEVVEELVRARHVRIERILSHGQSSPETGWYDQDEHEWVLVLQGAGRLLFDDQHEVLLSPGDYLLIPAHCRHRVLWTDPEQITVWLAVFFRDLTQRLIRHQGQRNLTALGGAEQDVLNDLGAGVHVAPDVHRFGCS